MLPSKRWRFTEKQARCSDCFLLSFGRYADSEAGPGITHKRPFLPRCFDAVGTPSFAPAFRDQRNKPANRLARGKRRSSKSPHSSHLETRTDHTGSSYGWFHPSNNNCFHSKEKNHEEVKGNAVDGGHRTWSGRSGNRCSSRLLSVR